MRGVSLERAAITASQHSCNWGRYLGQAKLPSNSSFRVFSEMKYDWGQRQPQKIPYSHHHNRLFKKQNKTKETNSTQTFWNNEYFFLLVFWWLFLVSSKRKAFCWSFPCLRLLQLQEALTSKVPLPGAHTPPMLSTAQLISHHIVIAPCFLSLQENIFSFAHFGMWKVHQVFE